MPEDQHSLCVKLVEALLQDLRNLASDTRRKYPSIKEAAEKQGTCLHSYLNSNEDLKSVILKHNAQLLAPFLNGCSTKQQKTTVLCLTAIQRFINNNCLSEEGAVAVIDNLWLLIDSNLEELRVLQTTILLLTSSSLVRGESLAKAFSLCIRLSGSKLASVVNTATAAIRQCSSAVFDRVVKEKSNSTLDSNENVNKNDVVRPEEIVPVDLSKLSPTSRDAYNLFHDICSLLNDEPAQWLFQTSEISRPLGLELIESLISVHSNLFSRHPAFAYLLKTNLCALMIRLFSPSLNLRSAPYSTSQSPSGIGEVASSAISMAASAVVHAGSSILGSSSVNQSGDKVSFAIMTRLQRLITVIVEHYFHLLNTECEIYLSLLIRFLDVDRVVWQRALALEVLHKFAVQPELIRQICTSYDMRPHSTKIFKELINALCNYVQLVLTNPSVGDELESSQSTNIATTPGKNQSLLYYKGSFFPIIQPKSFLVDMLDRVDPPSLPDGYCLSIAFGAILRVVNCLAILINNPSDTSEQTASSVAAQVIVLSWSSLHTVIYLLLESSADDQITASLLQSLHIMVGLCGKVHLDEARDAFLTVLCNAALPDSNTRTTSSKVNSGSPTSGHDINFERSAVVMVLSQTVGQHQAKPPSNNSGSTQSQTFSTLNVESHPPVPTGSLLVTAKNLQCARALILAAKTHGNVLGGPGWNIVLGTLQKLVWLLGLRIDPAAPLYFKSTVESGSSAASESVQGKPSGSAARPPLHSSSAVPAELQSLSSSLSDLFINSSKLDASALNDLILGLCQLSSESMQAVSVNKEPSQFPITKLSEVGLVNVDRLELWWDNTSSQLLSICKLSHPELRQLAVNALVLLIKQAMAAPHTPSFWTNETLTDQVLDPLSALSDVAYDDVREKQLECVQHMLYCWGTHIGRSWLRLIEIIWVIRDSFKVDLILTAFQCFKLIVTDYLPSLSPQCYPACIETAARFGQQQQDLNIALTAIGTILHLADHILQLDATSFAMDEANHEESRTLYDLWITIFCKLSDLCMDRRSTIRKSACQTLFNTIECHGTVRFNAATWSALFWQVLFPLLTRVREQCANAPVERELNKSNTLLIHHSRDTAAKQWAETVVLTLSGVANLFISKQDLLLPLDEFPKFWSTLLQQLEIHALCDCSEISQTALTCFQTLLDLDKFNLDRAGNLWLSAWETWLRIATSAVELRRGQEVNVDHVSNGKKPSILFLPTTSFLSLLFDLFTPLFLRVLTNFGTTDFSRLDNIFRYGLLTPLYAAYLYSTSSSGGGTGLSSLDNASLSQFQESFMRCLECLVQNFNATEGPLRQHLSSTVHLLLSLADYAVSVPKPEQAGPGRLEYVPLSYIVFAEKCLQLAVDTYLSSVHWDQQCKNAVLEAILKTLHKSMALKYACPSQSTWLLASRCFFQILDTTVPLLALKKASGEPDESSLRLSKLIMELLQDFLFCHQQPPSSLSIEEFQQHEELDCKFIDSISDLYLSSSVALPESFVSHLIHLLSMGSVQASVAPSRVTDESGFNIDALFDSVPSKTEPLSLEEHTPPLARATNMPRQPGIAVRQTQLIEDHDPFADYSLNFDIDLDRLRQHTFRENFARLCFSKLLRHAFGQPIVAGKTVPDETSVFTSSVSVTVSRTAVRGIIQRCRSTLIQFYQSAQLTGKCPLPRARLVEIAYVFKALTIMLTSLRSVSSHRDVDPSTWHQIIDLYPHIVDCILVTGGSPMIVALHRLLRLYGDLLRPACLGPTGTSPATREP